MILNLFKKNLRSRSKNSSNFKLFDYTRTFNILFNNLFHKPERTPNRVKRISGYFLFNYCIFSGMKIKK